MAIEILKEKNIIGFLLTGDITGNEVVEVIHDIELHCFKYGNVAVLFETTGFQTANFKINLKDFDLYKKYRSRLKKIAVVHESKTSPFISEQFQDFSETEVKIFGNEQIVEAQKWLSED